MFSFPSRYGHGSLIKQNDFVAEPNCVNSVNGQDSIVPSSSKEEKKSTEAGKSHKEAERRRRQRINAHLSTLRTLLPNTVKTDKASLLAEVVHRVKELRSKAADVARQDRRLCYSGCRGSEPEYSWPFPGESDELTLTYGDGEERGGGVIKATLCCDDRPSFIKDLTRAIRSARVRAVRVEMMTAGGRTKSAVVMESYGGGGGEEEIGVLRRALKEVVENRVTSYSLGRDMEGNKRARIGDPVN